MTRIPIWLAVLVLVLAMLACSFPSRQSGDSASSDIEGERMFQNFGCAGCHTDSNQGPSLVGIYGKEEEMENGETVVVDDAYLRESILEPDAKIVKGYQPIMPDFDPQLDEKEVDVLIGYIRSLESER